MTLKPALATLKKLKRIQHKYILPFAIGLLIILGPIIYFLVKNPETARAWYDDNWQYRVKYTIKNAGAAVNNQKVKLDIDTAALVTAGKVETACQDSRFTDANGNLLKFYIDTNAGACNTESTDYYVLLPTINSGDTVIYHYYGAPHAIFASEAANFSEPTFSPTSTSVASEQMGPGPVAYWKFDEGYDKKYDTRIEQQVEILNQEYSVTSYPWGTDRIKITFDNSASTEDLTDFLVLVKLNSSRIDYSKTQDQGQDIRFVDSDENTLLPYEIEKWDETGESIVWVKVPNIPAGSVTDYIYMYYNNNSASGAQTPNEVWSDYSMVYHYGEPSGTTGTGSVSDSTGNTASTPSAGIAFDQPGKVGTTANFSGGTGISTTSTIGSPPLTSPTTISFWINTTNYSSPSRQNPFNQAYGGWGTMTLETSGSINWYFGSNGGDSTPHASLPSGEVLSNGTWAYLTVVRDPNNGYTYSWYKDGTLLTSGTYDSNYPVIAAKTFTVGDGYVNPLNGLMDEFRVAKYARSADWINADYLSTIDSFNTYGTEEAAVADTTALPADNSLGIINFNPEDYNGETVYLEAIVSTDNATWTRARSNALEMPSTAKDYTIRLSAGDTVDTAPTVQLFNITDDTSAGTVQFGSANDQTVYIKTARLIIVQSSGAGLTSTKSSVEVGSSENTTSNSYTPLTEKKIYNYDESKYDPAPSTDFEATLKSELTEVKLEQQINILNKYYQPTIHASYGPTDNSLGIVHWDADMYPGATVYLEAVIYDGGDGEPGLALYTTSGTAVYQKYPLGTPNGWNRVRIGPITLTDETDYTVRVQSGDYWGYKGPVALKTAKLIVIQSDDQSINSTQTHIEVGDQDKVNGNTATVLPHEKVYYYDSSKFSPTPTTYFEANLLASEPKIEQQIPITSRYYPPIVHASYGPTDNSLGIVHWDADMYPGATVYLEAVIYDGGDGEPGLALYTTSGTAVYQKYPLGTSNGWNRVRIGPITLTDETDYTVRVQSGDYWGHKGPVALKTTKLIVIQTSTDLSSHGITATESQIEIGSYESQASSTETELEHKKVYYYDSSKFTPTPTAYFEASVKVPDPNPKIEQQVNILDTQHSTCSVTYAPTDNSLGLVQWDADRYTGATVYFEANIYAEAGQATYAALYDSAGNPVSGSEVSTTNGWARVRSGALTLTDDTNYTVRTHHTDCLEDTAIKGARLIIVQSNPIRITDTRTQIELGGYQTGFTNTDYAGLNTPKIYQYDQSKFSPTPESSGDVTFQASLRISDSSDTVYAELYNKTNGTQVAEASLTGTTNWSLVSVANVDSNANWDITNDDEYEVRIKCTDGGADGCSGSISNAKIVLDQADATGIRDIELVHQQISEVSTHSDSTYTNQAYKNYFNPENFSKGIFSYFFETDIKTSAGTGYAQLYNVSDSTVISNSELSTSNTNYTRLRSGNLADYMPVAGKELDTQLKNASTDTTSVSNSWLIIQVQDLVNNTATGYAELYNQTDGVVVTGSTVSFTSSSWSYSRSNAITLTTGKEYVVRLKSSIDGVPVYLQNSKLILNQSDALGITDTEILHQQANTVLTDSDGTYTSQGLINRFNPDLETNQNQFSGGNFNYFYESTLKTTAGTGYTRLYNTTSGAEIVGSEVSTANTAYTRVRTDSISNTLPSFTTYTVAQIFDTQIRNSATDTTYVSNSWLVIQASDLAQNSIVVYADLYNKTDGVQVAGSEISTTNTSWTRVRSDDITLVSEKEYAVRVKTNKPSGSTYINGAKIILNQTSASGISAVELIHTQLNSPNTESDSSYTDRDYWSLYSPGNFKGAAFNYLFEATMKTSAGTGYARLKNDSDGTVITGSDLTTTNTGYERVRSSSITNYMPTTDKTLDTQISNAGTDTTTVSTSSLIIQATNIGDPPVYAALYQNDSTCTNQVSGSEISVKPSDGGWVTAKTASPVVLDSGSDYMVCIKAEPGSKAWVSNAKIAHKQTDLTGIRKVEVYHTYNNTTVTDSDSSYTDQPFTNEYNPDNFTGDKEIYFESTIKTSAGTGYAQLYNSSDSVEVQNSEVSTTSTTYARQRSGAITMLSEAKDMDLRIKNAAADTTSVSTSWLIIDVTNEIPAIAHDSTKNQLNGAITDASWENRENCISGSCLKFDSTSDQVIVSDSKKLDFGASDSFTITGWFKHSSVNSSSSTLLSKFESTGTDGGYKITINDDGTLTFGISDVNTGFPKDYVTSSENFNDDAWHYLAAVKNGSTSISLYIDGVLIGTDSELTTGSLANNDPLYIGTSAQDTPDPWYGHIDELKFYPYVRSTQELHMDLLATGTNKGTFAVLGQSAKTAINDGLIAHWGMDESIAGSCTGTGDSCDLTGNQTPGTWYGDVVSSQGKLNRSVSLDGTDDRVKVKTTADWYGGWGWFDEAWTKRQLVTITNGTTTGLTDYQTKLSVNYATDMQTDFDDLRFTTVLGQELPYWIESKTDGVSAEVWVKVSSIPANSSTYVLVYYGNNQASTASSITNFFETEISGLLGFYDHINPASYPGSGTSWYDLSGNNQTYTLTGSLNWSASSGFYLNGSTYFTGPSSSAYPTGSSARSIVATATPTSLGGYKHLFHYGSAVTNQSFGIAASSTSISTHTWNGGCVQGSWAASVESQVVVTGEGGAQQVFKNGVLQGTCSTTSLATGSAQPARVGSRVTPAEYWVGYVKNVQIYNRVLSTTEVEALNSGKAYASPDYPGKTLIRKSAAVEPAVTWNGESSPGSLYGWKYRKLVTLNNSRSDTLTDYPVRVTISYEAGMDLEFDDLRFTDTSNNLLPYWIESKTDGVSADVLVKVNSLPMGNNTQIYLYFGNPAAQTLSTKSNTAFLFESMDIPPSGTLKGDALYEDTNHRVRLTRNVNTVNGQLEYPNTPESGYIATWRNYTGGGSGADASYLYSYASGTPTSEYLDNGYLFALDEYDDSLQVTNSGIIQSSSDNSVDEGTWRNVKVVLYEDAGTYYYQFWFRDELRIEGSSNKAALGSLLGWGARTGGSNNLHLIDDLVVFKYAYPEPTASLGTAEMNTTIINTSINDEMTISAWVNPTTLDANRRAIISRGDNPEQSWYIQTDPTNPGKLTYSADAGTNIGTSSATLTTDNWHHIIMTAGNGKTSLYINGLLDSETGFSGTVGSTGDLGIGNDPSGGTGWAGKIDEVRLYNKVFSADRALEEYNLNENFSAYWDFNEGTGLTIYDKSGNNIHVEWSGSGPHWTPGKYGKAGSFNGTDDYVNIMEEFSTLGTVSFWINPETDTTPLINLSDTANIQLSSGTVTTTGITSPSIYVNGVLTDTVNTNTWQYITVTTSTSVDADSLNLGKVGSSYYKGSMDDVRIYNYPRTISQVIEDMNLGHPIPGSPVGSPALWLKLDESYGDTANNSGNQGSAINGDLGGSANPCPESASCPTWTNSGRYDKALSFDGNDDYLSIPDNAALKPAQISFFSWVKLDTALSAQTQSYPAIASKRNGNYGFAMYFFKGDQELQISLGDGTTKVVSETVVSTHDWTNWHHVGFTHDGVSLNVYVDGVPVNTATHNFNISYDTTDMWLGKITDYAASTIDGTIDEVKLYNVALNESQVVMEYNRSKAFNMGTLSTESDGTSTSNSASRAYCVPGDTSTCNPPVAEWHFDEKSGTDIRDISGNNLHGTTGPDIDSNSWVRGKSTGALNFSGSTGSYATVEHDPKLASFTGFTLSAWINPSGNPGSDWGRIISKVRGTVDDDYALLHVGRNIGTQYEGGIGLRVNTNAGDYVYYTSNQRVLPNTGWHHVAATWDGTNIAIYIDGKHQATGNFGGSTTSGTLTNSGLQLRIGNHPDSRNIENFVGSVDQVRIYDYARSQAQIAWDYNRGDPVGWWKFDECEGTAIYDSTPNSSNGTLYIGTEGQNSSAGSCNSGVSTEAWNNGTDGQFNSSINFDGTDDYVTISGDKMPLGWSPRTLSFWAKIASSSWDAGIRTLVDYGTPNTRQTFGVGMNSYPNITVYTWNDDATINSHLDQDAGWTHFLVTYDGNTTIRTYINGLHIHTKTLADRLITGSSNVSVGKSGPAPHLGNFNNNIDDLRMYNYALTDYQAKQVYNDGAAIRFD